MIWGLRFEVCLLTRQWIVLEDEKKRYFLFSLPRQRGQRVESPLGPHRQQLLRTLISHISSLISHHCPPPVRASSSRLFCWLDWVAVCPLQDQLGGTWPCLPPHWPTVFLSNLPEVVTSKSCWQINNTDVIRCRMCQSGHRNHIDLTLSC